MRKTALYRYQAFGLRIDSEIELAELTVANDGGAQVSLRYGDLSEKITADRDTTYYQVSNDEFLFHFRGFATFYVGHGSTIIVQVCDDADLAIVRMLLLGMVMGMVLNQRGVMVMHASALTLGGRGILLVGLPGSGKSTMAAALCQDGWLFLADDIAAISRDKAGILQVHPGFPQQKLTAESAAMFGIETAGLKAVPEKSKFVVPRAATFCTQPVTVAAVCEIVCEPGGIAAVKPLNGMKKLECLIANTYIAPFLHPSGRKVENLQQCLLLANQAAVFRMTRPVGQADVSRQLSCFLEHFRGISAAPT